MFLRIRHLSFFFILLQSCIYSGPKDVINAFGEGKLRAIKINDLEVIVDDPILANYRINYDDNVQFDFELNEDGQLISIMWPETAPFLSQVLLNLADTIVTTSISYTVDGIESIVHKGENNSEIKRVDLTYSLGKLSTIRTVTPKVQVYDSVYYEDGMTMVNTIVEKSGLSPYNLAMICQPKEPIFLMAKSAGIIAQDSLQEAFDQFSIVDPEYPSGCFFNHFTPISGWESFLKSLNLYSSCDFYWLITEYSNGYRNESEMFNFNISDSDNYSFIWDFEYAQTNILKEWVIFPLLKPIENFEIIGMTDLIHDPYSGASYGQINIDMTYFYEYEVL